ncbi:diphthamide biosynthesis protein [Halodesulfurarchaeum formicicum]|uniref:2-(3-amino-3-carboxypropyl)histidine synthase n=1 Tax=Halodesulfurarchaeum formicicum TaxID=1873524 RepID=A0A1D8S555_9EURY|nr:diphthamide biosynthesis enzyme Dph2 [Halodesulfurarchaeum formicicum]AOW80484.1 diphthamide biosynthesis protein [Halodesulfurarchaeum formicicum]
MTDSDGWEGDLRDTGLALKHDREWDYELERVAEAVTEQAAETVGLQFPEGIKRRAPKVARDLEEHLPDRVQIYISGEANFGACDLDMDLMRRTDVFVHFGHSPMVESEGVVYVPLFSNVDVEPIMAEAIEHLEPGEVGLVTTAQHMNKFDAMQAFLEDRGFTVQTRRGDERLTHEGQVLGCNYASAKVPAEQVLYVGGGGFHPSGLAMDNPEKDVIIADPVNNVVKPASAEKFVKQRYAAIHQAMDAETWGIIAGTKIGQRRHGIAEQLAAENENAYLITLDEITPSHLKNFGLDAYVNTACPRITTDDGPQFDQPLLTPQEYRIAIGEEPMDALEFDTFEGTW